MIGMVRSQTSLILSRQSWEIGSPDIGLTSYGKGPLRERDETHCLPISTIVKIYLKTASSYLKLTGYKEGRKELFYLTKH